MVKLCSEIVNAALDLSQLDGSNMLTYSRMIYLLNSAYGRLYDYITGQTEDWGTACREVGLRSEVPRDLLKVRGVFRRYGAKEGDELERVDREPGPGQYWMRGEELVCGGHPGETFLLRYYPEPSTVTFPCKPEPTEYDRIYDNYIAATEGSAIRVANLRNGEELFYPVEGTLRDFVLVRGEPAYLNEAGELHYGDSVTAGVAELFQDKWGDFAFGYDTPDGDRIMVGWDGSVSARTGPWFNRLWDSKYRFDNGAILREFYGEHDKWEDITDTIVDVEKYNVTKVLFSNPYMAIELATKEGNSKSVMVVDNSGSRYTVLPMVRQGNIAPLSIIDFDHNDENGYGIIYSVRGQKEISGFAPDTAMDYPKTIYFDWLEAELARLFLVEARQDFSAVDALASQYWTRVLEDSERQTNYAHRLKDRRGILKRRH